MKRVPFYAIFEEKGYILRHYESKKRLDVNIRNIRVHFRPTFCGFLLDKGIFSLVSLHYGMFSAQFSLKRVLFC